jgi:hypothetical protein
MEGRAGGWCVQPDPCHGASAPRAVAGSRVRVLQSALGVQRFGGGRLPVRLYAT